MAGFVRYHSKEYKAERYVRRSDSLLSFCQWVAEMSFRKNVIEVLLFAEKSFKKSFASFGFLVLFLKNLIINSLVLAV